MELKKLKDFPLLKHLLLKLIHKLQVRAVKMENRSLYYLLSSIHFKLWFKMTLAHCLFDNRTEGKLAMKRHARIVVKHVYGLKKPTNEAEKLRRNLIAINTMKSFKNDFLLETEL